MTGGPLLALQGRVGHAFRDGALLSRALTHASYANERNAAARAGDAPVLHNETLEFLGDAVLGFVVAEHLLLAAPGEDEGRLSRRRASLVCERSLAGCARGLGVGPLLRLGKSAEKLGDRDNPSILSDAMEAVFAAVYLDGGLEAARAAILRCLAPELGRPPAEGALQDYKTRLQELLQDGKAAKATRAEYVVVREEGPDHSKTFTSRVLAGGEALGEGAGQTKKESDQNAAREALARLGAL
jgi:ribonuclease-3